MTYRLFLGLLLCGAVLSVTSCSDPTGVGANLGDSPVEDDSVTTQLIAADSVDTAPVTSKTGIEQDPTPAPGASNRPWRFLFGRVDDPLSGTVITEGYVDFVGSAPRDSAFSAADSTSLNAELRLRTTYAHGDTNSTLNVRLYDLTAEADMDGAPADTTFPVEATEIETYQISSPTDSLLTFELPQGWITEPGRPAVLQDSLGFEDSFNGFKIASSSGKVVVGIEHGSATLRVTTSTDTVDFQSLKSFTHMDRSGSSAMTLNDWSVLQDGAGQRLAVGWDFKSIADSLGNTPLNRADITVPVDTTKMKEFLPSSDFVRPAVNGYRVFGVRSPNAPDCGGIGLRPLSDAGAKCVLPTNTGAAPGAASITSQAAFTIFDRVLFGSPLFSSFEVEIAVRPDGTTRNTFQRGLPSTLPVLVKSAERFEPKKRPHAALTYTPL